jgi:hypothetical protein
VTTLRYVHQELERPVVAIAGSYTLTREVRLPLAEPPGGEAFYVVGHAVIDTSCCGLGGCGFASVIGLVREWHADHDDEGRVVSVVEPITDQALRARVRDLIASRERVTQVDFR